MMTELDRAATAKRWLNREAHAVRRPLAFAIAAGGVNGGLLIAQALLLAHLVDRTIFGHRPVADQLSPFAMLLGVVVLRALVVCAANRAAVSAGLAIKTGMRAALVSHIHALGPLWTTARAPGALATTVVDGVEALQDYYAAWLPQASVAVIVPIAILAVVFPVDWISGLILAGTAPLIPLFMVFLGRGAAALNERQWARMARLSAHFYEVLAGLPILKSFGAARTEAKLVARLSEDYRASTMRVLRVAFLSSFALEFLATLSIAMVAVLVGFRLLWGDVTFAAGLAALLLAPEFYLPLRKLGGAYHARLAAVAAAEDIADILAMPVSAPGGTRPFRPHAAFAVAFSKVSFSYAGGAPALCDVTFEIAAGERIAVVGASGGGKSTLARLLLGFAQPCSGRILVDGVSLAELSLADWRRQIAWVPQRAHLFAGTIAENITLGLSDATDEAVVAAAKHAHAHAFIERLPRRYDTLLGEDGAGLSGGEIQRIALARAFLRDAPLVVLDEPTASLDAESEAEILAAIETLAQGRTVLTIAHRLHTVRTADRIVMLEAGRVVAAGTHAALAEREGPYRRLLGAASPVAQPA
ncbi:MAG TPA: thiol reductant ABC exporter subunit CydD [Gammaproteobacteria bacterium]|nr:thiol reductant ABC exporter subunit CydD [Gammaproteobacteria bacterium]